MNSYVSEPQEIGREPDWLVRYVRLRAQVSHSIYVDSKLQQGLWETYASFAAKQYSLRLPNKITTRAKLESALSSLKLLDLYHLQGATHGHYYWPVGLRKKQSDLSVAMSYLNTPSWSEACSNISEDEARIRGFVDSAPWWKPIRVGRLAQRREGRD